MNQEYFYDVIIAKHLCFVEIEGKFKMRQAFGPRTSCLIAACEFLSYFMQSYDVCDVYTNIMENINVVCCNVHFLSFRKLHSLSCKKVNAGGGRPPDRSVGKMAKKCIRSLQIETSLLLNIFTNTKISIGSEFAFARLSAV